MTKYISSFSVALLALFLCALSAGAQGIIVRDGNPNDPFFTEFQKERARANPDYYTINPDSVRVKLIAVEDERDADYVTLKEQPPKDAASVLVTIEKIINIAEKIWKIVSDNRPVSNIDTKYATAYPDGVTSAAQLAEWSRPKTYIYGFYAENLYGGVMIDCKYRFSYTYNGTYKGVGRFLTGVAIIPTKVEVGWGYRFNMTAQVPDSTIANVGTDTDPVAAMQMKLTWKISTILKDVTGTSVYYIQGDGYFSEIASPWKKDVKKVEDVQSALPLLGPVSFN